MLSYKIKCPNCGKEFDYSLLKFQSRHVCETCKKKIIVETRMVTMLVQAAVFILLGQLYVQILPSMGIENSFFTYVILFILLFFLLVIRDEILVKLFGINSVFRVDMLIPINHKKTSDH